jgi:hypothetical protein
MPSTPTTGALVLGGGLAGTLAALVLASYADHVTIVERDRFPPGPQYRKGTPQARHTHLLMAGGARALDDLIPGALDELTSAGVKYLGIPNQVLASSPLGWPRRYEQMQFLLGCSRPFLDWFVRDKLTRLPIGCRQVSWPHLSSRILAPARGRVRPCSCGGLGLVGCGLEEGFVVVAAQKEGEAVQVGA